MTINPAPDSPLGKDVKVTRAADTSRHCSVCGRMRDADAGRLPCGTNSVAVAAVLGQGGAINMAVWVGPCLCRPEQDLLPSFPTAAGHREHCRGQRAGQRKEGERLLAAAAAAPPVCQGRCQQCDAKGLGCMRASWRALPAGGVATVEPNQRTHGHPCPARERLSGLRQALLLRAACLHGAMGRC